MAGAAAGAALTAPMVLTRRAIAAEPGAPLPIPPLMDVDGSAGNTITAATLFHLIRVPHI